jgi:uncharacterized protein (DUF2164 family)
MANIEFSKAEKELISSKIQQYFLKNMDQEIGQFEALFLLDFFTQEVGPYFYNRALFDAQLIINEKFEGIADGLYAIEQPTDFVAR